ncbi:adenylate/guanylate cyclase domain-containing protein [Aerosakkonemataceae cyanobacterium BLCC-F154]|uniref:Adenylate/guanylate cyclase domain-containing protein n=1 Tax=Floridaenema fluviatile BLCC-F154 TaxID=3153640 RepID=A0ABV4Y5L8_9CYAN
MKQILPSHKIIISFSAIFAFVIPFLLLIYQENLTLTHQVRLIRQERLSLKYQRYLREPLANLIQHRQLAYSYLKGQGFLKQNVLSKQHHIDNYFQAVDALKKEKIFTLENYQKWQLIKQQWLEIKQKTFSQTAEESFAHHTLLIKHILSLMANVGNLSEQSPKLVINSDNSPKYILNLLPATVENLAQVKLISSNIADRKKWPDREKGRLVTLSRSIKSNSVLSKRGIEKILVEHRELQPQLTAYFQEAVSSKNLFLEMLNKQLISPKTINIQPIEIFASATEAIESELRLYDVMQPAIDELLELRINKLLETQYLIRIFGLIGLLFVIYLLIKIIRKLNSHKEYERALLQAESKYRSIFENATEGIYQTTPDGKFISANPALAKILGYDSAEELINTITDISTQVYVEPKIRGKFVSTLKKNHKTQRFVSLARRKDGTTIWISEKAHSVKNSQGELLYYEGSVEDVTNRKIAEEAIQYQQEQTERLLFNILPGPIAVRLQMQESTIADSFSEATVLFADIVNFTELCTAIPPTELVKLLNEIFSVFDRLAEQYGLEKIKTIGDAYMVAGGIPIFREDHAKAIADMALDMLKEIKNFHTKEGQPFSIRIGINSGPVVAGVIGIKKIIYDLWGDTVNIASRMESQGVPDKIQVTEFTYKILCGKYLFQERGMIPIKGKGEMKTYFLIDKL